MAEIKKPVVVAKKSAVAAGAEATRVADVIESTAGKIGIKALYRVNMGNYEHSEQTMEISLSTDYTDEQLEEAIAKAQVALTAMNNTLVETMASHGLVPQMAAGAEADNSGAEATGDDGVEVPEEGGATQHTDAELKKMSVADLKTLATTYEIPIKGLQRADIVEAIKSYEDQGGGEAEGVEDVEEIPEEIPEEDATPSLEDTLAPMTRNELKIYIRDNDLKELVIVRTSMTDDQIREAIIANSPEPETVEGVEELPEEEVGGEAERRVELEGLKPVEVKQTALKLGIKTKDKKTADLIEEILGKEFEGSGAEEEMIEV